MWLGFEVMKKRKFKKRKAKCVILSTTFDESFQNE